MDSYNTLGLEMAWVNGPWSVHTKYLQQSLNRVNQANLSFDSWYVMGSYFFTGESRNYDQNYGIFGSVKPTKSIGAWEMGLRCSEMDLNDLAAQGGQVKNWTLGLNWYINKEWKMALNYFDSKAQKQDVKDAPKLLQLRLQFLF